MTVYYSMTIINRTRSVVLSENVKEAKTYKEKKLGLLGSDGKTGLFMKTRWGVHTFGMKFPTDVLILDTKNRVVRYKRNLQPSRIFFWNPKHNQVIEIPTNLVGEETVEIGDEISIT
ncbi:MAG: DUF192 domain-containing protein [Candidatus Wolfebacteria bacterium]|nr:DUF192 domain-containing protein [Candidatus Wolfebacteria bacterium]